jgi:predicted ATP-binding protein involved in virulence
VQGQQDEITNQLRKRLIFQAVKYESFNRPRAFEELSSRYALAQRLAAQKETITSILQQLGLTADEVQTGLNPFFDSLSGLLKTPDIEKDLKALLEQKRSHHLPQSVLEWITNWPQLDRISAISEAVQSYINDNNRLGEPIDRYLSIVNSFLADSGKALQVSRTEGLQVQIGDRKPIPITSLSSGESQIVVLITHLVFNPAAEPANVFIIDEPELSLHLRWQELFVESLRKANPKIQMILATHSPSIILDDAEHCLDLSGALYDQVRN